jgi:hypothetical protein
MRLANTQLFADYGPFGMMLMASPTLSEEETLAVKGPSLGGALGLSAMSKPALVAPPHSVARPPLGETGMFVVSEAPNKATVSPSENTAIPELPVLIVVPSPECARSLERVAARATGVGQASAAVSQNASFRPYSAEEHEHPRVVGGRSNLVPVEILREASLDGVADQGEPLRRRYRDCTRLVRNGDDRHVESDNTGGGGNRDNRVARGRIVFDLAPFKDDWYGGRGRGGSGGCGWKTALVDNSHPL